MTSVLRAVARAFGSFPSAVRWSLAAVEDEPRATIVPVPGPAHGPIPAIDLVRDARRRKATRA